MSELQHDEESFAIGWISISDLLMLGTLSLLLVSRGLENRSEDQMKQISNLTAGAEEKAQALADADTRLLNERKLRNELETKLVSATAERTRLESVKADLSARVEEYACEIEELTTAKARIDKNLADTEAQVAAVHLKLFAEKIRSGALVASLEFEKKNLTESAERLSKLSEELALEKQRNGVLHVDNESLKTLVRDIEIRERGFRQELLGIRARNNSLNRVVYVVDCSGSMNDAVIGTGNRWSYVREVIEKWLKLLPCKEAQVITFSDTSPEVFPQPKTFVSMVGDAEQRTKATESLVGFLASKVPDGGTDTFAGLSKAYESNDIDAIFLFTDGQPMDKSPDKMTSADYKRLQDKVLDLIATHGSDGDRIPINVIGLGDYFSQTGSSPDQVHLPFGKFLVRIADESGGVFLGR